MAALGPGSPWAARVPGRAARRPLQGVPPGAQLRRRPWRTRVARAGAQRAEAEAVSSERGGPGLGAERFRSRPPSGLFQNSRILGAPSRAHALERDRPGPPDCAHHALWLRHPASVSPYARRG